MLINKFKLKIKHFFTSDKSFAQVVKGSIYNLSSAIISIILGFVINLIIARYYGASILGTFSLVTSVLSIVIIFTLIGTNTALLRLIPEHVSKYSHISAYNIFIKVFKIVVILSIIISIVIYMISPLISIYVIKNEDLSILLRISSIFIIFNSLFIILLATLRALGSTKLYALLQLLLPISNVTVLVVLTTFFNNEYIPVYAWISSYFILFVISLYFTIKLITKYKNTDTRSENKILKYKHIISISFPMFLTSSMILIISQIDIIMLGIFASEKIVGIFTIVAKLSLLANFILITINTIIGPKFSKLYFEKNHTDLKSLLKKSTYLIVFSSIPIAIILVVFGEFILESFGNEFMLGYNSLLVLVIGYTLLLVAGPIEMFMNMTGKQKTLNFIYLIGGTLNIILNYLLIPIYGMIGASSATIISLLCIKLVILIYIRYNSSYYKTDLEY